MSEVQRRPRKQGAEHFLKLVRDLPEPSPRTLFGQLEELGYRGQELARRALCLMAYRHVRRVKRIHLEGVDRAARALGRVEARIEARTKPDLESDFDDSPPRKVRAPTAPPPISPVSSRSGSVAPRKSLEQMTQREYETHRREGGGR